MKLSIAHERFKVDGHFTIARGSRTAADVLRVSLEVDGFVGNGECVPYARYDETIESVSALIESQRQALLDGLDRDALQKALPSGAARNALDCALWDLEAKRQGCAVWELAEINKPQAVITAYTLSLDSPEAMQSAAKLNAHRPLLKIKLGGDLSEGGDLERLAAVRTGAPDATLIVDANEGWSAADYDTLAPVMSSLGVALVEQPLPADSDNELAGRPRPLPVCADESCHDCASLDTMVGKYDFINIKLDKTGGLTEALALRELARQRGLGIMVGCMLSSSLSMAPASLVAQGADFVDLDGPLLLAEDREEPIVFEGSLMHPASAKLWG